MTTNDGKNGNHGSFSQQMLKSGVEDFLARGSTWSDIVELDHSETGYSAETWRTASEIGWLGIVTPEAYGGTGGSLTDAAVVFEALGGGPVPGPFFSSGVLAPLLLTALANDAQQERLLPALATGEAICALAMTEPEWGWGTRAVQMRAERSADGWYTLTGTKLFVFDALTAKHLIVVARTDAGIVSMVVETSSRGVAIRRMPGFLTSECVVELQGVQVPADSVLPGSETALQQALLRATPVLCAQMVGGAQQVYEMSVEYSRSRKQFGQPIGRFQHVQNHIVQLVNYLDGARWTIYEALWKLDEGRKGTDVAAHLAKICASEGYLQATNYAHEVHAGIGVMWEYGLTLYTRASRSLYHSLAFRSPAVVGSPTHRTAIPQVARSARTEYDKPIPQPDPFVGKPYRDGGKEGRLMLPRCTSCSKTHFCPRSMCPHCGRDTIEWFEATGFGFLHPFAVQHRGVGAWQKEVPYVTAFIDLMEGDRVFTVLRGVDPNKPEEIRIGAKCKIEWDKASDEVYMPYWRIVEE